MEKKEGYGWFRKNRFHEMKDILGRIANISTSLDSTGISIRFLNYRDDWHLNNLQSETDVYRALRRIRPQGVTRLGTILREKIVDPMIVSKAKKKKLEKSFLVTIITDGDVSAGQPVANSCYLKD
jgi:hypothetical protein